jgi:DNA polymerase III epsilon subunit-like protein
MLLAQGYSGVGYLRAGAELLLGDLELGPEDAGPGGLALTLFKALQLVHSADLAPGFSDYVAFDLETTDLDSDICDIVELAAVRVRGGQPVDQFQVLVRGGRPISPRATAVHGYTDRDVAGAPPLPQVWPDFVAFAGHDVLVAHNGQRFDVPVLRRLAGNLPGFDSLTFFDTYPIAKSLFRDSARLGDLATRLQVEAGRAHHALDDARTLAGVFAQLTRRQMVRARTASLTNLLDYLGLGLALEPDARRDGEGAVLFDLAAGYTLGRFTECLEVYQSERERLGAAGLPTVEEVIACFPGGQRRREQLRAEPDPARRYPASMARLDALLKDSEAATLEEGIRRLLERVTLSTSEGPEVAPDRVNLLTLHATKGLEFDCVYVVGVEDGQLPGLKPGREVMRHEVEEARRLLYVGMTRARDRLVLTRARERRGVPGGGNRFLDEMGLRALTPE